MMLTGLPPSYVDVASALATRGAVNVMGIVVDVWGSGVFKTQGTSFCITFTIKDSNLDNGHTWDGLKIKYFKDKECLLPAVQLGDVVLVRDLWVKVMEGGQPLGIAAGVREIKWAVFQANQDPMSHGSALSGPVPFEPTYKEKTFASSLQAASPTTFRTISTSKPSVTQGQTPTLASNSQLKFSLLKDVKDRQYVDLVGEIVKIHSNDSEKLALYFTDYTSNDNFFCYVSENDDEPGYGREGDEYNYQPRPKSKWKGPSGRMTIQITLWEPHASYVRDKFKENDILRLKNVRIKGSRVEGGILEGVIHTDRDNPRSANAFTVDFKNDHRVIQLLARREDFQKAHSKKSKREPDEDVENPSNKKQKVKGQKEKAGQMPLALIKPDSKRDSVNSNIATLTPASVRPIPLDGIINNDFHLNNGPDGISYRLPFQNLCYLSTVRVVDFYPPHLEDFAVSQEHASIAYNRSRDAGTQETFRKWEWRFCLLVEDTEPPAPGRPKARTKLWVSNSEGEHLLNFSAVDLRKNSNTMVKLQESLFQLWGELEEKKKAAMKHVNTGSDAAILKMVAMARLAVVRKAVLDGKGDSGCIKRRFVHDLA